MENRFLYRIFDKETNEMNYQTLEDITEDELWFDGKTSNWQVFSECRHGDGRFVIMQSTSRKDKNDKVIYEDDLVKVRKEAGYSECYSYQIYKVRWSSYDLGRFELVDAEGFGCSNTSYICDIEVIGNIHENKERFVPNE